MIETSDSIIELLEHSVLQNAGVTCAIKRDDLLHPQVSGNKWRKLKYHLIEFRKNNAAGIVSFGGAHSNHIHALAAACQQLSIPCIGIIRGELGASMSPTLSDAKAMGMQLNFVGRSEYRNDKIRLAEAIAPNLDWYVVPEGGSGPIGLRGCQELLAEVPKDRFDSIAVASGTGATAAGIWTSLRSGESLRVYPALKGDFTRADILGQADADQAKLWVASEYHFGGYAKTSEELFRFIRGFYTETGVKLDPVYTGKMMYGLFADIEKKKIPAGTRVLAIHTGGLQGVRGIELREGIALFSS